MLNFLLKIPRWCASAVVLSAVLYLTLWPNPLPDNDIPFWEHTDKVVHALMMLGLYWALAWDVRRGSPWWLMLAVILFGGVIELLQDAMGMGRGGSWLDLAADSVGALIAWFTYPYLPLPKQNEGNTR